MRARSTARTDRNAWGFESGWRVGAARPRRDPSERGPSARGTTRDSCSQRVAQRRDVSPRRLSHVNLAALARRRYPAAMRRHRMHSSKPSLRFARYLAGLAALAPCSLQVAHAAQDAKAPPRLPAVEDFVLPRTTEPAHTDTPSIDTEHHISS